MLLVLTSNRAVSLQTVAQDIVTAAFEAGIKASWLPRQLAPIEVKQQASAEVTIMPFDPLLSAPWILLNRDLTKGGVRNLYYATIEGKVNRRFLANWMREVRYVANSNYTAEKLREAGLSIEAVVPHGVDMKMVEKAKKMKSLGLAYLQKHGLDPSRHVVVLTIANSHPRKGLAWLDKVIKVVESKNPDIKFLVVTEPKGLDYFSQHQNLVVSTDFGKLPRLTVLSLIASVHVLAIPSLSEGFGLPALEAMALGTPVVHAELPPLMEFSTGFTVPVKEIYEFDRQVVGPSGIIYEQHLYDVNEFADVLLQVVDMYRNKKEAIKDWRAKSLEVARKYDIRAVYPALIKLVQGG
jgi:glycosyltransferase involved in cell wall biosynthesis